MAWNEVINLIAAIVIAAPVSIVIAQLLKQSHWPDGANAALARSCASLSGSRRRGSPAT